MAKMRRAAALDWQHGVSVPHPDAYWDNENWNPVPSEHSIAIVNHGEQRHALQVKSINPDHGDKRWYWSIHRQTGPRIHDPEHWEWVPETQNRDMAAHLRGVDGNPGFFSPTREDAMRRAEAAWEHYVGTRDAARDRVLDEGVRGGLDPEGGYDIFGERP